MATNFYAPVRRGYEGVDGVFEGRVVSSEVAEKEYGGGEGVGDKYWAVRWMDRKGEWAGKGGGWVCSMDGNDW